MTESGSHKLPILKDAPDEASAAGSYFVANYPPFSFWTPEHNAEVHRRLDEAPTPGVPLGLYIHIPFCRKRCDFCYYKVYTDKNARAIHRYLDAVIAEAGAYAARSYLAGRAPRFVYFGGGTPSYLSAPQLEYLFKGLQRHISWEGAEEIAFECEPGTLQESKIKILRELGVTRLSLGVENFDPTILEINNRAHRAVEIDRAYNYAREVGFEQINIDLIAGMIGETQANWESCIEKTIQRKPESVTIYQMEIPYNTTNYRRMREGGPDAVPVADWRTKRRWLDEAFARLEEAGYLIGSAYTAVRDPSVKFLYRDALWTGADMLGLGVSSFSHLGGVHFQNENHFDPYVDRIEAGELPIHRSLVATPEERLIREFILQLKLGAVRDSYFREKFGVSVIDRFAPQLDRHAEGGYLRVVNGGVQTTRTGLLQIDRLLHDFFLERHRETRIA
ncbi:MAG: coproporphyrinogen III oxidase family protein [Phycisphaerales bacterium]|nr:coproporphyrinogen III oxidase family protein [Phycisphaerales bacterium]